MVQKYTTIIKKRGKENGAYYAMIKETGDRICLKLAEGDSEDYYKYRGHAFSKIMDCSEKGYFHEKAIVAWG